VLDLTRVIAGPVATRMLAALGADVLRIDPPHLPELELSIRDGCPGKRLAQLELTKNLNVLDDLLSHADVLIHGYRPGALAAAGLDAARHPHLVVVSLSAWGHEGPWARRRGFDSLVQSACGIAAAQGDGTEPGVLPAQALDHATGYLMAAAALRGMAARRRGEPHADARLALAATAAELMRHPAPDADSQPAESQRWLTALDGQTLVAPPGELDGRPLRWRHGPLASEPTWL
jgi:crotonobetainyl-CoA:carnitine CoA-transferase CaiB-like acyl-CoA transferase